MPTHQADLAIGTTAAEAAVLAATQAAIEAGKDPFGDDDDDSATVALSGDEVDDGDDTGADDGAADDGDEAGQEADAGAEGENADTDLTPEQLAAVAAAADAQAAPELPQFKVQSPAEYAQARKDLLDKRAKAFKDYADGVIEPDEYSRIDGEVFDALEALTVQRTLHEANTQREVNAWDAALDSVMTAAKEAGTIDYTTDAAAAKQFDMATAMLKVDGKQRTPAQLATDAHKAVLAMRGIADKTPTPKADPAQPRTNGKPPVTLRNAPAAAVANTGGGWQDQLAKLSGQEYEDAFARLTPAQQAQMRGD